MAAVFFSWTHVGKNRGFRRGVLMAGVSVLVLLSASGSSVAATYLIKDSEKLSAILKDPKLRPGDVIQLASGIYSSPNGFVATVSGAKGKPITLKGTVDSRLKMPDGVANGYGFYLRANYWKLTGFIVEYSKKGIVLDRASNNVIDGVTVRNIDEEAIHLRVFSSRNVISNSTISNTGRKNKEFGEGVYIGSAMDKWPNSDNTGGPPDQSNDNCVYKNTFGPNVSTEGIDVKEGTSGGRFIGNVYDNPSMTEASVKINGGDSFMDVKGDNNTIYDNKVKNTQANSALYFGFQVNEKTSGNLVFGKNNVFLKNYVDLNRSRKSTGSETLHYGFKVSVSDTNKGNVVCDGLTSHGNYNTVIKAPDGFSNLPLSQLVNCSALKPVTVCADVLNQ